jgi:HEAT repeat protein
MPGFFGKRKHQPPRSQIAEIERLYFRAVREMLVDIPDYAQVINDLQRILSIDWHYKNARHYLERAQILQQENGAAVNKTIEQTQAAFDNLQDQLVDVDPAVRKAVVMSFIQFGEQAVDPLTALLMDDDADVRVHATTALGWVGGRDAVLPLLVALTDSDTQVRRHAATALSWVIDDSAVDALIASLEDEDHYVRCYSARALGWSQARRAVEPLKDLLHDNNLEVREYAATALMDLE